MAVPPKSRVALVRNNYQNNSDQRALANTPPTRGKENNLSSSGTGRGQQESWVDHDDVAPAKAQNKRKTIVLTEKEYKKSSKAGSEMFNCLQKLSEESWNRHLQNKGVSTFTTSFHGQSRNTAYCSNCKRISLFYRSFLYLDIPLTMENTQTNVENSRGSAGASSSSETCLNLCFRAFNQGVESRSPIGGCPHCKYKGPVKKSLAVEKYPRVLTLRLGRVLRDSQNRERKISRPVSFPVSGFCPPGGPERTKVVYDLYAVLSHVGNSAEEGHFIVHAKNLYRQRWYTFNDSHITELKLHSTHFISKEAYVLFYKLREAPSVERPLSADAYRVKTKVHRRKKLSLPTRSHKVSIKDANGSYGSVSSKSWSPRHADRQPNAEEDRSSHSETKYDPNNVNGPEKWVLPGFSRDSPDSDSSDDPWSWSNSPTGAHTAAIRTNHHAFLPRHVTRLSRTPQDLDPASLSIEFLCTGRPGGSSSSAETVKMFDQQHATGNAVSMPKESRKCRGCDIWMQ